MITVFCDQEFAEGGELELSDGAARHVRVRRAEPGDPIRVVDGRGTVGTGSLATVARRAVSVVVEEVASEARPSELIAVVPVADRDRMLWAAEKCVELRVTRWQPVIYERSKSVSPRGDGATFAAKLRLRMQSALEQSGAAWLPELRPPLTATDAWREVQAPTRLLLDRGGSSIVSRTATNAVAFAVGPEGGFEKNEVDEAHERGWISVSLGPTILRFETAIVAAAAVIRATQLQTEEVS
jgi:16S rRNA (uracil1498-N3)-methyltransferase